MRRAGLARNQADSILDLLRAFDLPIRLPDNFPREKIFEALPYDKKFEGGEIRFVLTPFIGSAFLTADVTMDDIRRAVDQL